VWRLTPLQQNHLVFSIFLPKWQELIKKISIQYLNINTYRYENIKLLIWLLIFVDFGNSGINELLPTSVKAK
jgi:hypothetical protein